MSWLHCNGRFAFGLLTGLLVFAPAWGEAQTAVYYSVGTSFPTDLKYGTPTVTLTAGTATFSSPQLNHIGVGDQVTYGGATVAFITGRTSSTVYSVRTGTGTVPPDVAGQAVNSITRAFGTLTAAVTGSSDASHLNSTNLVGLNRQLHWAMYNDGPMDDRQINIQGYTTGANNYIRVFAPVLTSQVGSSQRHEGRAGTGFRFRPAYTPVGSSEVIEVTADHVRIEGIEIDASRVTGILDAYYVIRLSATGASDVRFDKLILHDLTNAVSGAAQSDLACIHFGVANVNLSNSLCYAVHNFNSHTQSDIYGLRLSGSSAATLYLHNNTVYDIASRVDGPSNVHGISPAGTATVNVRNTAVLNVTRTAFSAALSCFQNSFGASSSNNVSSDSTAPGAGSLLRQTAFASYFVSVSPGAEDLHLQGDSLALWGGNGADLDADANLPVVDDVDGQARHATQPDIGADEYSALSGLPMLVKSGKYQGTGSAGTPVYVGFQPDVVFVKRVGGAPDLNAVVRTSTMGANTKSLDNAGVALAPNLVTSLDPTGFTVGSDPAVNQGTGGTCGAGCTYYWVAFKAGPSYMKVGTYTGDGATLQSIGGVGFEPDYVIVLPEGAGDPAGMPVWTASTFPVGDSFDFDATFRSPGAITGLESGGFQVGQGNAGAFQAPDLNVNSATYHYVAWNAVPGRMAVGTYLGNGSDNQYKSQVGFSPEWVLVKKDDILTGAGNERAVTHKPASTGTNNETVGGLRFAEIPPLTDTIQKLLPQGFEVGTDERVNSATDATCRGGAAPLCTYHWVAFGPHQPQINYRSIGTRGPFGTLDTDGNGSSVDATQGDPHVHGNGASVLWRTFNRGRGDVILIDLVPYMVASVNSETDLTLASPYAGPTGGGKAYSIRRQHTTLQAWEDCISFNSDGGAGSDACTYFDVASVSLVDDDRSEIGIAYNDSVVPSAADFTAGVKINGGATNGNTDAGHTITLTADPGNRNQGIPGAGVLVDNTGPNSAVWILDDYVTVEFLEIMGAGGTPWGIYVEQTSPGTGTVGASRFVFRNNLIHTTGFGISLSDDDVVADVYNNIIYSGSVGLRVSSTILFPWTQIRFFNNTIYNYSIAAFDCSVIASGLPQQITVINNIAADPGGGAQQPGFVPAAPVNPGSGNNLSTDGTAVNVGVNAITNRTLAQVAFVNEGAGNLHIQAASDAVNAGANLSRLFFHDIDFAVRQTPWDIGADDQAATTAVTLQSLSASGLDGAVSVRWETASELQNLGFHLYRSESEGGPYNRITTALIPGLGSSPTGKGYEYRDAGLVNGRRYFYKLEDVETTGKTEMHGPVSAVPMPGSVGGDPPTPTTRSGSPTPGTVYGKPEATSLTVLERTNQHVLLELRTGGFNAYPEPDGTVRIEVPGFEESLETGLPVKRAVVEAIAGKKVRVASVVSSEETSYPGLLAASARRREIEVKGAGEVTISRERDHRRRGRVEAARLEATMFQGEVKKAEVLFSPLREEQGHLVLSGRILVRLEFVGAESQEVGTGGSRGRSARKGAVRSSGGPLAQLGVSESGLYRVAFEEVFGPYRRGVAVSKLRLSRRGEAVAYHLEPGSGTFGPGSVLYFLSAGSALNPYGEAVYELEESTESLQMPVVAGGASGEGLTEALAEVGREENKYYQPGLLEADDLWQWDLVMSSSTDRTSYPFTLTQVSPTATSGELVVDLQGASDFEEVSDHHLRLFLNEVPVGETSFDGKVPSQVRLPVASGILREGDNELRIENAGDTGAAYSMVFLNRFSVRYPRRLVAEGGRFEGQFLGGGRAEVTGVSSSALVVDSTEAVPRWIEGVPTSGGVAFRAEAGRRYLASSAVRSPRVISALPSTLRSVENQADYLVIGPQAFLEVAEPLLDLRRSQGLVSRGVSTEEVFQQFGHGENTPEAIREFLEYAYQHWKQPSVRYVLLLGDATYDPKDYLETGVKNQVPAAMVKTTYLWTASDPAYAAVNGSDLVPDLAIGRLSASSVAEARVLVEKVLAYESSGRSLAGAATLVADNPDQAGDFEGNANEIATTLLSSRNPERIFLREQGALTRPAIHAALDGGLSLLSYVGHGGTAVWASENVFNDHDVTSLAPQPQQPLLLTMNCLNGFFHFPPLDSLAEALVKAEGKGAIAAFSPSGLSQDDAAHVYHKALLGEIVSGRHQRLGDAVLAAQAVYADSGAFPELLSIYQLLGDPALKIQ